MQGIPPFSATPKYHTHTHTCLYISHYCAIIFLSSLPSMIDFLPPHSCIYVCTICIGIIHTYIHTYIHPYIHACMHTYIHMYICYTHPKTDLPFGQFHWYLQCFGSHFRQYLWHQKFDRMMVFVHFCDDMWKQHLQRWPVALYWSCLMM